MKILYEVLCIVIISLAFFGFLVAIESLFDAGKAPIAPVQTSKLKAVNCVVVNIKGSEVNLKCSQSLFSLSP